MRLFKKCCAVLYLVAAVVVAGGFAAQEFGDAGLRLRVGQLLDHPAGRIALIISLAIVALGTLIVVAWALLERRPPASVHPAGNPHIEVRLAAVSSVARAAVSGEDVMIERVRSRVAGHDASQVRIALELIAFTDIGLESLGKRIQLRVQEACERMLGVPGVTVQVTFLPSTTTTVTKEVPREQA